MPMANTKNSLLNKLESDPVFAEHYWRLQDQIHQESDKFDSINLSQTDFIQPKPKKLANTIKMPF